ncbi:hypothetical protein Ndes2526A_g07650 [Nannochloris sp. 'desiccata']
MVPVHPAMELILPNGILPRPAQRNFARMYLLNHRIRPIDTRLYRNHRVFPEFSPAETSHLFTAAAAASAATALSLETLKASARHLTAAHLPEVDANEQFENESALPQPPVLSSVEEIWRAAWAGLDDKADECSNIKNLNMEGGANAPITTPLLWLQGLRGDARRRLLALSLAALESAINKNIIKNNSAVTATAATSADVCNSILKESSAAAANAWLGYLPAGLEHAIVGSKKKEKSREVTGTTGEKKERKRGQQQRDDAEADDVDSSSLGIDWYAIEERVSVYCSVIRLLQSTQIIEAPISDQNTEFKKGGEVEEEEESLSSTATTTAPSLRAAAKASLLSTNDEGVSSASLCYNLSPEACSVPGTSRINGWRATQSGTKSQSQLITLAPSVLQDMAVRVADVVAAAYLEEAARGTWRPATSSLLYSSEESSSSSISANRDINRNTEMDDVAGSSIDLIQQSSNAAYALVSNMVQRHTPPPVELAAAAAAEIVIKQQQVVDNMSSSSPFISSSSSSTTTSLEASWWPVFSHPRIGSTRQLQRFSNRLLFSRWVDTTFHSVVAAYDDRLPLFTLCAPGGLLRVRQAPIRRAAQLAALTGIRYYVSLVLEAVDAAAPTLKMLWERTTAAVAWLLTYGLGKGIGLVWKGLKIGVSTVANDNGSSSRSRSSSSTTTRKNATAVSRDPMKRRSTQEQNRQEGGTGEASRGGGGGCNGSLILVPGSS